MVKQGTRVLVTGGAGFLGAHLTRALAHAGAQVRVLDDLSSGRRARLNGCPNLELVQADVRNADAVARAIEGANAVVHLAHVRASDDPALAHEVNLGGTLNVLEAARAAVRAERPRVILCSSGSVYGRQSALVLHEELQPRPATPDAVLALAVEGYGRVFRDSHGVPVTTLRLYRTFGPEENPERPEASVVARFIRAALDGASPAIHGDGQQARDLVYVDNVVGAIAAALGCEPPLEPVNIASGEAVTINFLWTLILELSGKRRMAIEPTYIPAPPWEPKQLRPQIARACQALSWAPSVRLREGLSRTVKHYVALRETDPNAWFTPREEVETPPVPTRPRGRALTPPMGTPVSGASETSWPGHTKEVSRPGRAPAMPPPPPAAAVMGSHPRTTPSATRTTIPPSSARTPTPVPPSYARTPTPVPPTSARTPTPVPPSRAMSRAPAPTAPAPTLAERAAAERSSSSQVVPLLDADLDETDLDEVEWAPVPSIPGFGR